MAALESEMSPVSIWRKNNNDFVFPGQYGEDTLVAGYRKGDGIFFKGAYDEPTYLTFRVEFDFDCAEDYAMAAVGSGNAQYNEMPHPLFNVIYNDVFSANPQKNTSKMDGDFLKDSNLESTIINNNELKSPGNIYSTYNYLKYNLGEEYRAFMLLKLKALLYDIQFNYPYYFTSIEGIQNLMKVDTKKGIRIPESNNTITITCNEALDLRITQFINLYRKIVWDDTYQRWILPDMMRYFKLRIHIFEMRMFHEMVRTNEGTEAGVNVQVPLKKNGKPKRITQGMIMRGHGIQNAPSYDLVSSYINDLLPTITIECLQCEFDFNDSMSHIGNLSSNSKQKTNLAPKIKIHVGNIIETQSYNLNKITNDNYYSDKALSRDRLYSDDNIYEGDAWSKTYKSNSSTINRLGIDTSEDTYSSERNFDSQLMNFIDQNGLPPFSRTIMWPSMIRSIFDYGVNWIKDKTIDGVDWLLSQPIGKNGATVGGVLGSAAVGINLLNEGNFTFFHSLLKEAIKGNPAVEEAERHAGEATRIEGGSRGLSDQLARAIIGNMPISMATDINNKLKEVYELGLKGHSNEAITDTDRGYVPLDMKQGPYISTANTGKVDDHMDPKDKGLSNEAIDDLDNGYVHRQMIQSPYISTANALPLFDQMNPFNRGTSNEAITDMDHGYVPSNLKQPPYTSTANSGVVKDPFNQADKGQSNEAIDDTDNGYIGFALNQPQYRSTATSVGVINNTQAANQGVSNEAIDDLDNGYVAPGLMK